MKYRLKKWVIGYMFVAVLVFFQLYSLTKGNVVDVLPQTIVYLQEKIEPSTTELPTSELRTTKPTTDLPTTDLPTTDTPTTQLFKPEVCHQSLPDYYQQKAADWMLNPQPMSFCGDVFYYNNFTTCVGGGKFGTSCPRGQVVCTSGDGLTHGSGDQQIIAVLEALQNGGVHESCPNKLLIQKYNNSRIVPASFPDISVILPKDCPTSLNKSYFVYYFRNWGIDPTGITLCDGIFYYNNISTCVGGGPANASCPQGEVVCGNLDRHVYGYAHSQVNTVIEAIRNDGIHQNCPNRSKKRRNVYLDLTWTRENFSHLLFDSISYEHEGTSENSSNVSLGVVQHNVTLSEKGNGICSTGDVIYGLPCTEGTNNLLRKPFYKDLKRLLTFPNIRKFKTVVVLNTYWGEQYSHFMIEMLPRLYAGQKLVHSNGFDDAKYLLSGVQYQISRDIIKALGLESSLIFRKNDAPIYATTAIYPHAVQCGNVEPVFFPQVRSFLLQKYETEVLQQTSEKRKEYILVMKRTCVKRCITNHDELMEELARRFPYELFVEYENPDITESTIFEGFQVESALLRTIHFFYGAKVIIGPHGAGFSNMIFSPTDIKVVEITMLNPPRETFLRLSQVLHNEHIFFRTKPKAKFNVDLDVMGFVEFMELVLAR